MRGFIASSRAPFVPSRGTRAAWLTGMSEAQQCIDDCTACRRACEEAVQFCRTKNHRLELVSLLVDCAEACAACIGFAKRGSEHLAMYGGACSEIAERLAERLVAASEEPLAACERACRKCALTCNLIA